MSIWVLCFLVFALCVPVDAQQPKKTSRVGFLRHGSRPDPLVDAFRRGLRELGYLEGDNLAIEYRWTGGNSDHLKTFAQELARLKLDAIVAPGVLAARAVKETTSSIPVVFTAIPDPVGGGIVSNLARPERNVTGLSAISSDLSGKRLELFKETYPKLSRLAILSTPAEEGGQASGTEITAKAFGLHSEIFHIRERNDIDKAFLSMEKGNSNGFVVLGSGILFEYRKTLTHWALRERRPAMYPHAGFIENTGLISYGPDFSDLFRRAAIYVDKILKGAKPADLPVEQPTKFELVVNLTAAKQIGLTVPPNVLARADRVIR